MSDTYTMAPPAKARPNANSRGLGFLANTTMRLPSPVASPAASVTASAIQRLCDDTASMWRDVLVE